jgi:hypothetical protein
MKNRSVIDGGRLPGEDEKEGTTCERAETAYDYDDDGLGCV